MKLSKREKIMVTLLLFVLLWAVAFRFLLVPMYTGLENKDYEILELEDRKQEMDLYLKRFGGLEDTLKEEQDKAEKHAYFLRDIDDIYVDRDIQTMAEKHQVELKGMDISLPELLGAEDKNTDGEGTQDTENQENIGKGADPAIYIIRCTVTVMGDKNNIMTMADEIYQRNQSVVVTGLDVKMEYSNDGNGNPAATGLRGTMSLEYYYLDEA